MDSGSIVNPMILGYILKLGLKIRLINVKILKINIFTFKTFEIVLANFQVEDKLEKAWFFQKTFLLVNISIKVVFGCRFLPSIMQTSSLLRKNLSVSLTLLIKPYQLLTGWKSLTKRNLLKWRQINILKASQYT